MTTYQAPMFLGILLISACYLDPDSNNSKLDVCPAVQSDMPSCTVIDLAPAPPKCAAAKGLAGDPLICVDFKDLANQTLMGKPAALSDWDFDLKGCWEIASGKLQVKNFSNFMSSCMFTMPAVVAADFQKYGSFTLAVVQRVDLNSLQQKAQVMLGGDDEQQRLLDWMTGKQPRKQWVQTITKSDLPAMSASSFQPWFKLYSAVVVGGTAIGWQIESIAVMGNP